MDAGTYNEYPNEHTSSNYDTITGHPTGVLQKYLLGWHGKARHGLSCDQTAP